MPVLRARLAILAASLGAAVAGPGAAGLAPRPEPRAQTRPASSDPRAVATVERAIAALGGRDRLARIKTVVRAGTSRSSFEDEGTIRLWVDLERGLQRQDVSGPGVYRRVAVGIPGADGVPRVDLWEAGELRAVTGPDRQTWLRWRSPWPELEWLSKGFVLSYAGIETIGGRRLERVHVRDSEGQSIEVSYDAETGLLAQRVERQGAAGDGVPAAIVTSFRNYRERDGVLWATEVTRQVGAVVNTFSLGLPETNGAIPAEIWDVSFRPPDEELHLTTTPRRIFREASSEDPAFDTLQFRLEAPAFDVDAGGALTVSLSKDGTRVLTQGITGAALTALRNPASLRELPARAPEFLVMLRFPAALEADVLEVELEEGGGRRGRLRKSCTRYEGITELHLPIQGRAAVLAGHGPLEPHSTNAAQAFALDWVPCDAGGRLLREGTRGDTAADYVGYGAPVLAPAPGIVVRMRDDVPENPQPGGAASFQPFFVDPTASFGNHVVLDHGGGEYSLLGQLLPGSLRVLLGARVDRGEIVGAVGMSGRASIPHLHFQLMDGPDPIASNGLPIRLRGVVDVPFDRRDPVPQRGMLLRNLRSQGAVSGVEATSRPQAAPDRGNEPNRSKAGG